jgi:hypothetical protein
MCLSLKRRAAVDMALRNNDEIQLLTVATMACSAAVSGRRKQA